MAGIPASDIISLVRSTQDDLGRFKWSDIASDLQKHIAMRELLKKKRRKIQGGTNVVWSVGYQDNSSARHVGLYATDIVNRVDGVLRPSIPWRHTTFNCGIDRREISMNMRDPHKIIDVVKFNRWQAWTSFAELMESTFWTCPADDTDEVTPYGLQYWLYTQTQSTETSYASPHDTASTGGFLDANKTGFTSGRGSVSSATYANWSNWNCQYTDVSKDDLIAKMRRGAYETDWTSAVDHPDYGTDSGGRVIYTNYDVCSTMERILENQNETLGNDVASKDGKVRFKGNPVVAVPYLDDDASDPVYQVDWDWFNIYCLEGEYLTHTKVDANANAHTVTEDHWDMSWNTRCFNPKYMAVYSLS